MYVVRRVTPARDVSSWVPGNTSCRSRHSPSWRVPAARPRRRQSTRRAPLRGHRHSSAGGGRGSRRVWVDHRDARTANAHGKRAASRTGWPSPTRRAAVTARCATRRRATRSSASGGARSSSTDCGSRSDRRRRRAPSASTGHSSRSPPLADASTSRCRRRRAAPGRRAATHPGSPSRPARPARAQGPCRSRCRRTPTAQARSSVVTIAGQPYLIEQAGAVIGGPVPPPPAPATPASRAAC